MLTNKKHNLSCKVWIDCGGKPVLGKDGAQILEGINSEKSLTNSAKKNRYVVPLRLELYSKD
jgi:molybdenum-dependent DNA-binding transcriptional regulator ModE